MGLITVLTRDAELTASLYATFRERRSVVVARSWDRLVWLVRERPVIGVVLDSGAVRGVLDPDELVTELRRRFPSIGAVFVSRPELDPLMLLRLGRAGISDLTVMPLDSLAQDLGRAVTRAMSGSTRALVLRAVGARLPRPEHDVLRSALDGSLMGWQADDLAKEAGWTRAHLSVRLRAVGLPSAGHLLLWAKLLHAGRWLTDPGRSAESVSRQLEYSSGAAFRRALKNYLEATPTQVSEAGGLAVVMRRFLDVCGLVDSVWDGRVVA